MTTALPKFLLDANVFIEAHRRYYAFDICPGFWDCLLHHTKDASIYSIDRVRDEIKAGDKLGAWIKDATPKTLFFSTDEPSIAQQFSLIMQWAQSSKHYKPEAKAEFAQVADGWLVAFAKAHNYTVVTHEVLDPLAKKRIPIPNVCKEFKVPYMDTFEMLRGLRAKFNWKQA